MNDYRFNVDMDIYEGRPIDVGEIMVAKAAKHAVEAIVYDVGDEGTTRLTSSPTTNPIVDEDMANAKDE
ncbi:hypothetical protein DEO72_LG3g1239 [Vigna unguiculata]|uniref:Uncharacterized protein n=1 Tax=Vigna unguiculata TaxID=3917 RepID=A0A4D6LEN0_VIGUN|nr:hypothetical protein DEO72_LG3g1239 [Vigna unguiculata]